VNFEFYLFAKQKCDRNKIKAFTYTLQKKYFFLIKKSVLDLDKNQNLYYLHN